MMADASEAKKYSTFSPGRQREISSPCGPEDVIRNSADVLRGVVVPCACALLSELRLYWTGMESDSRTVSVLMPTRSGDPLLVATHWPGNLDDLKQQAKAP